ncbi:hypothetical protein WR30_24200 [Burkholderia contaminans FFH2055]|nr:hypothetical protein NL30_04400 [Burkholderia contaminans]AOL06967.1 hypothetical protein WI95_23860 [Burkholderia contaminans]KKL33665.1 hypothetical protein WR30_24200 [Burkholderia contaminans FFH2055]
MRARAQPARATGGHAEAAFMRAIVASLHRLVRRINGTATTPCAGAAGQSSPGRHAATRRP